MNKTKSLRILLYIGIAVILLGALYFIFQKDIQKFGDWLERMDERKQEYKRNNPNASKSEMDAAFSKGINDLEKRKEWYQKDNPDATESDIEKAWNDAWGK